MPRIGKRSLMRCTARHLRIKPRRRPTPRFWTRENTSALPSTMERILNANKEVRERRDQLRHPTHVKPQLKATTPNQVWSWDITKLLGPKKWTSNHRYVVIDIYIR